MRLTDPLAAVLNPRLDARVSGVDRPITLALSGGGDSLALMHLAADWARARGQTLIALTVDHALHPDSARWTAEAGRIAQSLGLDWRSLTWTGVKPSTGLAAAARRARHALLAEATRVAGARVLLMAHTADDVAEGDLMRARGSTLGRLSEWSPSPVWPEGREVMLLRPLLATRRDILRSWLRERGIAWLDDPANADERQPRIQARRAIVRRDTLAVPTGRPAGPISRASPEEGFAGLIRLRRDCSATDLAAAMVCAGGGETPPRGRRLTALTERLRRPGAVVATLSGARITADGAGLAIHREAGEARRGGLARLSLNAGEPAVWDGRYEIAVDRAGLTVAPLKGLASALAAGDRALIASLPAAVRPCLPVLIGDALERPVLAWRAARVRCLVPGRYFRAVGGSTQAGDLEAPTDGEMAPGSLSR